MNKPYYEYRNDNSPAYFRQSRNTVCHLHVHQNMELVFVTDGVLRMIIGDEKYEIAKGDVVLIESFTPHSFIEGETNSCYIIEHSQGLVPFFSEYIRDNVITDCKIHLDENLFKYIKEQISVRNIKKTNEMNFFCGIVMPIYSEFVAKGTFAPRNIKYNDVFLSTLSYITANLAGDLSLGTISKKLFIRPETLCRKFSESAGMSLHEYVCRQRVYNACELLYRGNSITDTASNVGFGSIRTFNRLFKKYMNQTPTEYTNNLFAGQ